MSIELSSSQKQMLQALVDLHKKKGGAVKGKQIGERINRNPGTIRNKMQSLQSLGLVEGVPGPKGGYRPASSAYEVLDLEDLEEEADILVLREGELVEGLNVTDINLMNVHDPNMCRAEITVRGSIRIFSQGDKIEVGPTPVSGLIISGKVVGKTASNNLLICNISDMKAPAN